MEEVDELLDVLALNLATLYLQEALPEQSWPICWGHHGSPSWPSSLVAQVVMSGSLLLRLMVAEGSGQNENDR